MKKNFCILLVIFCACFCACSNTLTDLTADEYEAFKYEETPKDRPDHGDVGTISENMLMDEVIAVLGYPQHSKNFYSEPSVRYSLNDECSVYIIYGKDNEDNVRVKEIVHCNQRVYSDADESDKRVPLNLAKDITANMAYSEITAKIGYPHKIHDNFYIADYHIDDGSILTVSYILKDDGHLYSENAKLISR